MKTLKAKAKLVKEIDLAINSVDAHTNSLLNISRTNIVNEIFEAGYELEQGTYKLIKSICKRSKIPTLQIAIVWSVDDIVPIAKEYEIECNPSKILEQLEKNHDANYGITWDTINSMILDNNTKECPF